MSQVSDRNSSEAQKELVQTELEELTLCVIELSRELGPLVKDAQSLTASCSRWSCWQRWREWCKPLVVMIYLMILLVALPLLVYELYRRGAENSFKAWFVGGIFVLLTLPISAAGILQHIFNYTKPHLQKHIIRILWIVPIYSLDSWLGLVLPATAIYWDALRECYEAYVLYNFLCYLLNFLESECDVLSALETPVKQPIPCCCCPPWPAGRRFIFWCKFGTLQYTVARLLLTLLALITQWCGVYEKGKFKPDGAWIYLSTVNAISQMVALHSLIYFYMGTRKLLGPIRPVGKFLSIKAIVFAIFWQAVFVAILVKVLDLPNKWKDHKDYGIEKVSEGLENFIICIEMLLFAVAHYFVFSHKPYVDPAAARAPCITSCLRMLDVRDVAGDIKEHFVDPIPRPKLPNVSHRRSKRHNSIETDPLLNACQSYGTINSDKKLATALNANEISSEFSILTYGHLDPKPPFGRLSAMSKNGHDDHCLAETEGAKRPTTPEGVNSSHELESDQGSLCEQQGL